MIFSFSFFLKNKIVAFLELHLLVRCRFPRKGESRNTRPKKEKKEMEEADGERKREERRRDREKQQERERER